MDDPTQATPPGPPQASSPAEFREAHSVAAFRLVRAELRVTLFDDPHHARYTFTGELETLGPVPATEWFYNIQADVAEVVQPRAWDGHGGLETSLAPAENGTSIFTVRFRNPVPRGRRYEFSVCYETAIRAVASYGVLEQTVTYSDWHIFNVECGLFGTTIELPPGRQLIRAIPAADDDRRGSVRYRTRLLRA
jgi:hypothetical protein